LYVVLAANGGVWRMRLLERRDGFVRGAEPNSKRKWPAVCMNKRTIATLCIVYRHPRLLLGMKKRGFGIGRWNGFGGKVLEGESIEEAARRELLEEVGLEATGLSYAGMLNFRFRTGSPTFLEVHVFRVLNFLRTPCETEEMKPQWFHIERIPFNEMWPGDREWLPLFLAGKKFEGNFLFQDHYTLVDSQLTVRKF